jgi:hypothetical protein
MSDDSKQLRLSPEGGHQGRATLHRTQVRPSVLLQIRQISGTEVGHRVRLEITPDALDGIEFGCVRWQILQGDRPALALDILAYQIGAVRLQSIPDDQQLLADRGRECLQELGDLRTLDRAGEQAEVEPQETHPRDSRQLLPTEAVLQDRSFASWRPGACATGTLGQTRPVYEDDDSSLSRCDFFSSGHLLFF